MGPYQIAERPTSKRLPFEGLSLTISDIFRQLNIRDTERMDLTTVRLTRLEVLHREMELTVI